MAQVIHFNYFATGSALITLAIFIIFIILHQTQPDVKIPACSPLHHDNWAAEETAENIF